MAKQKSLMKGMLAGMAGGLVAAWMTKQLMAGPDSGVQEAVKPAGHDARPQWEGVATMKAADEIGRGATDELSASTADETGGPLVHYAFGVLTGGIYGGLAEYSGVVRSGFGTGFGGVLFSTADVFAVPAFGLAAARTETSASPLAAHVVYGVTTELVRRLVRMVL